MTIPFFYILRHNVTNIRYAGIKFAKGCNPSDLLRTYFTSSAIVKPMLLEDRTCFSIEQIIEFETKEQAIDFEEAFLTERQAHLSPEWYNQSAGRAINPDRVVETCMEKYGVDNWMKSEEAKSQKLGFKEGNTHGCFPRSDETKKKMSESFTGRVYSDEHNEKLRQSKLGTKASDETKQKLSDIRKGKPRPASFSAKMSEKMKGENNPMFGKVSPNKGKTLEKFECECCGAHVSKANYNKWHGENCKKQ
jgi:hypothetical protein